MTNNVFDFILERINAIAGTYDVCTVMREDPILIDIQNQNSAVLIRLEDESITVMNLLDENSPVEFVSLPMNIQSAIICVEDMCEYTCNTHMMISPDSVPSPEKFIRGLVSRWASVHKIIPFLEFGRKILAPTSGRDPIVMCSSQNLQEVRIRCGDEILYSHLNGDDTENLIAWILEHLQ